MTNSDNGPVDARTVASQLDATDGVILDMLEKDGRATLSHLSEATGLSVSAVQSRVQKLERRGVIRGYTAIVAAPEEGLREIRRIWTVETALPADLVEASSKAISTCEMRWRQARARSPCGPSCCRSISRSTAWK